MKIASCCAVLLLAVGATGSLPVWPAPLYVAGGNSSGKIALSSAFDFAFTGAGTPATIIKGFDRYRALTRPNRAAQTPTADGQLATLSVSTDDASEGVPQHGFDESYTLKILQGGSGGEPSATLHAATVYGALRGLETFSQLVEFDYGSSVYTVNSTTVVDAPRFPHRGFMVDTSRHFQTVGMLKRLLDSMSYAKMNVLHWHAVDDQSFPLTLDSYPNLQGHGAFSPRERYTKLDVEDIIEYARLRGIRVMIEIDTPSHTSCWCRGYPNVCPPKPCKDGVTRTPLDPSKDETFTMIQDILQELAPQFPEEMMHVGQDEVDVGCWSESQNPTIAKWQAAVSGSQLSTVAATFQHILRVPAISDDVIAHITRHGFVTPDQAYVYTANRIEAGVRKLKKRPVQWWPGLCLGAGTGNRSCGNPSGFCPCRGVVGDNPSDVGLDTDTVLQLWSGPARLDWNNSVAQVVKAGYSAIQSQGWYLEDIHLTATWQFFYDNEPMAGIDDPKEQARVLGGEACMWGEYIDGSALLDTAWPRAAAAAERLWSPRGHTSMDANVQGRLASFRCLLLERGIPAGTLGMAASPYGLAKAGQPPEGPGSCYAQ